MISVIQDFTCFRLKANRISASIQNAGSISATHVNHKGPSSATSAHLASLSAAKWATARVKYALMPIASNATRMAQISVTSA